jgi:hypothetical protein
VQYDGVDVNIADYDGDGHLDIGGPSGIGGALTSGTRRGHDAHQPDALTGDSPAGAPTNPRGAPAGA